MDQTFSELVSKLPSLLNSLISCPVSQGKPQPGLILPSRAAYLFSSLNEHLYVGRTNRLKARICEHMSGRNNDAPFAFKLARHETGHLKAKGGLTRKMLELDPNFSEAFSAAKARVVKMEWRWVEIKDANLQCLFEVYATIALSAKFNDFENH